MSEKRTPYVGRSVKRTEDPRLIRGLGHYLDDLTLPGLLHVAFVRSIYAHGRINEIDAGAARALPGVVAVVTGDDLVGKVGQVPVAASIAGMRVPEHPALARGKVRFVGEPVAAVVAETRYGARDAAEAVAVDVEPLDAAIDPEAALAPGAPLVHEAFGTNLAFEWKVAGGDVDAAFGAADRVIAQPIVNQRLIPVAMEPRGVMAHYLPGEDLLTVWSSTQIPHLLKTQLAKILGMAESRVRVITPEVGGGFGSKLNVYAEEAVLAHLARQLSRPVKWAETRRENFQATIHGRDQRGTLEIALKNDGTVLGLRYRVLADIGAYHQLLTPAIPTLTGLMLPGCYKIPSILMEVRGVFTNKMSTDAYRGAGRPEATFTVERAMDLVARELRMDPARVRRKNFPRPSEFPFKTATGLSYDSGDYLQTLDMALDRVGYERLREEQKAAREKGRLIGIGVSTYVEICAMGPSSDMAAGGWESATVRVDPTGKVTVLTGASPHGQGQETSFAQLAADLFQVDLGDVLVLHGDTAQVQYGIGTFGSRATAVGGTAVLRAGEQVLAKARRLAAHLLGAPPDGVKYEDGRFQAGGQSLAWSAVAEAAHHAKDLPEGMEPGLQATYFFEPKNYTFPFGCHVAVVEVDRETGDVKFLRYVAVDDCGRVLNPLLVDGQVHGGVVQALGQALFEECIYDAGGQLATGTLMDYAVPKAHQVPRMETGRTETPTDVNPLGVKGVGEAGTIGATPAIANAVIDALAPFGVKHLDMPLRPEKVWRAMQGGAR